MQKSLFSVIERVSSSGQGVSTYLEYIFFVKLLGFFRKQTIFGWIEKNWENGHELGIGNRLIAGRKIALKSRFAQKICSIPDDWLSHNSNLAPKQFYQIHALFAIYVSLSQIWLIKCILIPDRTFSHSRNSPR